MTAPDKAVAQKVFLAEQQGFRELIKLWNMLADKCGFITETIKIPHQRGTALRLLLLLGEELTSSVFPILVELASIGHSDIALCRAVIKSMPRKWVTQHIKPIASRILASGDSEEFRRLAELYVELDQTLLRNHINAALAHIDEEIREVGTDFEKRL